MKPSISWKPLPAILLVAYIIFVSYNFYSLDYRLNYLLNHPVNVLQYARDIKTRLGEMQHTLPGLMATPELTYSDIVKVLKTQEDLQDISFSKIREHFVGNPQFIDNLHKAFIKIRQLRREAASSLIGNNDYTRSTEIYQSKLAPQVKVVESAVDDIVNSAQNLLIDKKEQSEKDVVLNVLITVIVGMFIILCFIIVNSQEKKKTKLLQDRDKLFNQLSQNVDEIFIIVTDDHKFEYSSTNSKRIINIDAQEMLDNPESLYNFSLRRMPSGLKAC